METNAKDAFIKGMNDLPLRFQVEVKNKIMAMLGIRNRQSWRLRRDGHVEHSPAERVAIEKIFKEYNVNAPWGKE